MMSYFLLFINKEDAFVKLQTNSKVRNVTRKTIV